MATKPKLIENYDDGYIRRKTYLNRVVETDAKIVEHFTEHLEYLEGEDKGETRTWKRTRTIQKFLCVNGPLSGQRLVPEKAKGYLVYNKASGWKTQNLPTAVLVWFEKGK